MRRHSIIRHMKMYPIAALLVVAACGDSGADEVSDDSSTTATAPPTTVTTSLHTTPTTSPATSTPTTTTLAPSSTTEPLAVTPTSQPAMTEPSMPATTIVGQNDDGFLLVDDLVLHGEGIGPFTFGTSSIEVHDNLQPLLGYPAESFTEEYPNTADGVFLDEFGEIEFVQPYGETVCYENGLCVDFGGDTPDDLTLLGYTQDAPTGDEPTLATADGVTVGSRWADYEDIFEVGEGGCYSIGSGAVGGIELTLVSDGTPFIEITDDGESTYHRPEPDDVHVVSLAAGDRPINLLDDC